MGSYISVGIVYCNDNMSNLEKDLKSIIMGIKCIDEVKLEYPEDNSCMRWKNEYYSNCENVSHWINKLELTFLSKLTLNIHIRDYSLNVILSIGENRETYRGVLFEISEEELFQKCKLNLQNVTKAVAQHIANWYKFASFDYAFCDSEAEIEYGWEELQEIEDKKYSMLVYKNKDNQIVANLSTWCIDGLSPQKDGILFVSELL